jgi:hypothetical protein
LAHHWIGQGGHNCLSFSMISFGVPFGTQSPCQDDTSNPGNPASSAVGMSRADARRSLPVTAWTLIRPARTCGRAVAGLSNNMSSRPAIKSCWPGRCRDRAQAESVCRWRPETRRR